MIKELEKLFNTSSFCWDPWYNPMYKKDIIIYGAGLGFNIFFLNFKDYYRFNVYLVLDQKFKEKTTFNNIKATTLENYTPSEYEKLNSLVIITISNEIDVKSIITNLKEKGFRHIQLSGDLYPFNTPVLIDEIKEKGLLYFNENKNNILNTFNLFSNEESKLIYYKFLRTHITRIPESFKSENNEDQYFHYIKSFDKFIMCGAYNGDTIKNLNKKFGKIDSLICIEPDIECFKDLSKYLNENKNEIANNIIALPCAILDTESRLYFKSTNTNFNLISNEGDIVVQCVSLDNILFNFKPTAIAMDIEGSELKALKGMENLIKESKPDLTISVYHSPNDIWEIPLYLNNLNLGYKFYLKNYTSFCIDTVLYAIIEK